ncbi:MAG: hypothetical protein Kow009_11400 [Spirochaetales bacterium]
MEMEGGTSFISQLQTALEQYRDHLDSVELPRMKEQYRILHTSFLSIYRLLLKKGLIHEDPYKKDLKISEISIPPEDPFLDSEKTQQMSIRLSIFESQLDFLLNFYQFRTDFFDLGRIKLLLRLTRYIAWDQFSESSAKINTKVLAEFVGKITKGDDSLSAGVLKDAVDQIQKAFRNCMTILKKLTDYHKEAYKFEVRISLLSTLPIERERVLASRDEILRTLKKQFPSALPGKHFYPELIQEILEEDYGSNGPELRKALLEKFKIEQPVQIPKTQQVPYKEILLEGIRALAAASRPLEEAAQKLLDNSLVLESRKRPLIERIRIWFQRMVQKEEEALVYEVEFFDVTTSTTKKEPIRFHPFLEDLKKRSRIYNGILSRTSTMYKRMEQAGEEQLFTFLRKHIEELQLVHRRLSGLDTFFRSETPRENRASIRGIKIELTGLKNAIMKANQKRHDYVAKKEEMEQLRKLGVDVTSL